MVLGKLLFQLKEDAWLWLWFWDFLGRKMSRKLSWLHFFQRSFVHCEVKALLSSVPCQVEIRLECIIPPAVTLQQQQVIPSAYTVLTAGLEAPISHLHRQPVTHQVLALTVIGKGIYRICAWAFEHFFLVCFFLFLQDLKLPLILLHLIILSMNKNPFRVRKVLCQSP